MTQNPIKLFAVVLLTTIGTAVATTPKPPDTELDQISGYRQWARVTAQPIFVPTRIDFSSVAI
jgi:hypothetical protein